MAKFIWRKGFEARISADAVGDELSRLREENGGRLTPKDVVEAARRRGSSLHDLFTWDDTEAANKWRLSEARRVIGGLCYVHPENENKEPLIAYVSIRTEPAGRCYIDSRQVMGDQDLRVQALQECRQAIEAWRRRYRNLEEITRALDAFEGELADV